MTTAADDCTAGQLHVCAMRVCELDTNGEPLVGDASMYVTNVLALATLKPVYNAGTEIKELNACGEQLIDYLDDPNFVRADIELDFIVPDPQLLAILIANSVVLAGGGGETGWAFPPVGTVTGNGVSIEMFTKRVINGAQATDFPWGHWALPYVRSLQLGDRAFSGTAAQHTLITGQCNENPNWFDGPANDWDAPSDRVAQFLKVASIPDIVCGPQPVIAS